MAGVEGDILRLGGGAVADGIGFLAAPGALLVRRGRGQAGEPTLALLAAGKPSEVDDHPAAAKARRVDRPEALLVPGLVNAHTHLDLTHIGPISFDHSTGFAAWIDIVRAGRRADEQGIAESVQRGVELCAAGATVAVGDIAGAVRGRAGTMAGRALARAGGAAGLSGVSYVEFFALGEGRDGALDLALEVLDALPDQGGIRFGLQPHASYSVAEDVFRASAQAAVERGVPWCTHLAESPEERRFIASGQGPLRELLDRIGVWDAATAAMFNQGLSPVEHLRGTLAWLSGALRAAERGLPPPLVVHVNDASDNDIGILAGCGASVAYCPRASAYFAAEKAFGPHRYRDMQSAGINVCLGTDSIINLPTAAAEAARGGMSVLDEMRLLYRRDGADPRTLLSMATVNGASALGLEPSAFVFGSAPGLTRPVLGGRPIGGVAAVPFKPGHPGGPIAAALAGDGVPELLASGVI